MQRHEVFDGIAARGPVIPVVQFESPDEAVSVCRALVAGGIRTVEITLRTAAAFAAIEAVAALGEDLFIGAGTILSPSQMGDAAQAGARFAVSPGFSMKLVEAAERRGMPLLPGVMTPSEVMVAHDAAYTRLKFFPADSAGGVKAVAAMAGPFPDVRFCPTGGVRADNAADYLALPNVMCVGGSWLVPRGLVAAGDWKGITELAKAAATLQRPR
jgi:2-dehydro-3-deoxyphosphogluconate aldolase/(4S)-4-hydroxy-2-oxoglutarate aldolase